MFVMWQGTRANFNEYAKMRKQYEEKWPRDAWPIQKRPQRAAGGRIASPRLSNRLGVSTSAPPAAFRASPSPFAGMRHAATAKERARVQQGLKRFGWRR